MFTSEEWRVLYFTWAVIGMFFFLSMIIKRNLSIEKPKKLQILAEITINGLEKMSSEIMGKERVQRLFPFIFSLFLFILLCNLIGVFPLSISPTNTLNTTIALSLITFIVVTVNGIREIKISYFKKYLGPVVFLIPMMLFIEIIGEISKPFSLSLRLFANVFGEEEVYEQIFHLVPLLVPIIIKFLMIFTDFLQSFVFIILTMVYIEMAAEHH
ncbi:MAG TPA: ATP synthase F0 subunit A [Spirochaetia bacterium]|nr:MAG: ATP synthase F0 subunit A [Spirochaetes bacterium GWB1_36_13]HCL57207.1 ATP synthase F0 subunit A [Spirochaetia bacterium]